MWCSGSVQLVRGRIVNRGLFLSNKFLSAIEAMKSLVKSDKAYLAHVVKSLAGVHPRECPICGYNGKFKAFGSPPRWDAMCPSCFSLERQRLLYLAISRSFPLPAECEALHFAPEFSIQRFIKPKAKTYKTADLMGSGVDLKLNIERIDLKDNSFDAVICCHVLEHVNDQLALTELYRILRPSGLLYLMVPIIEGWERTYENAAVTTDTGRNLHFGQRDHVRYFGSDLRSKIGQAGFNLKEFTAEGEDVIRYGLMRGEKVFVCSK